MMEDEEISSRNRRAVNQFLAEHWRTAEMAVRGNLYDLTVVGGVVAEENGKIQGLLTCVPENGGLEILSLDSLAENRGVGTELLRRAVDIAGRQGLRRLTLVTTNDNLRAMGFYQRRGFDMTRLFHGAVDEARRRKPEIPLVGDNRIPIRHEIEFVLKL